MTSYVEDNTKEMTIADYEKLCKKAKQLKKKRRKQNKFKLPR